MRGHKRGHPDAGLPLRAVRTAGPRDSRDNHQTTPETTRSLETVGSAAAKLGVTSASLRALCRRSGERVGDCVVALLPDGVVAFKFGGHWRVRFPNGTAFRLTADASAVASP
jgi:hypothetical protein